MIHDALFCSKTILVPFLGTRLYNKNNKLYVSDANLMQSENIPCFIITHPKQNQAHPFERLGSNTYLDNKRAYPYTYPAATKSVVELGNSERQGTGTMCRPVHGFFMPIVLWWA